MLGMLLITTFLQTLGKELGVLGGGFTGGHDAVEFLGGAGALALKNDGGDEALDFGGLGGGLFALAGDLATNDIFTDVVVFGEVKKFTNLGSTLGTKTTGHGGIGQARNISLADLDDDQREDSQIGGDDAATDTLTLALPGATGTVAGVTLGEEETDTVWDEDTLLHGEALLVVAPTDLEDVPLPLVAQAVCLDQLGHALVIKVTEFPLIIHFNHLLASRKWVRNIQLHDGCCVRVYVCVCVTECVLDEGVFLGFGLWAVGCGLGCEIGRAHV